LRNKESKIQGAEFELVESNEVEAKARVALLSATNKKATLNALNIHSSVTFSLLNNYFIKS
jgi:hypothetical protein